MKWFLTVILLLPFSSHAQLSKKISNEIETYSTVYRVNPRIIKAIVLVESQGKEYAYGKHGEIGLMQIIPKGKQKLICGRNLWNIQVNLEVGIKVFKLFLRQSHGNLNEALVRYNGSYRHPRNGYRYLDKFWKAYLST